MWILDRGLSQCSNFPRSSSTRLANMAPKKAASKEKDAPKEGAAPAPKEQSPAERYEELRKFYRSTAMLQLFYILVRTAWHFGLPHFFRVQPFIPLVPEVCAAELLLVLLLWAAGAFGPAAKERHWMLNTYNILALIVLAKCVTDCFVYNFSPHMWAHFRPGKLWGIPSLLAAKLPGTLGLEPRIIKSAAEFFERTFDIICLLGSFRGVRAGKTMILERRAQNKALLQKKEK